MFDTLSDRLTGPFPTCAARADSPTPTSTPPRARSASRCWRRTSRCRWCARFIARIKERATGAEVSGALNPAQQVIKIVNEELIDDPRRRDPTAAVRQEAADGDHARRPAGLRQDDAGRQARPVAQGPGPHAAAGRLRPAAAQRRHPAAGGRRAGRGAGLRTGARQRRRRPGRRRPPRHRARPVEQARHRRRRHRRPARRRRRADAQAVEHPRRRAARTRSCSSSTR